LYVKKRLKKENNIVKESIISLILVLTINSRLLTGKKPPDEIRDKDKLNELKALKSLRYKIIKINMVKIR
tara:strand:+ start:125 stop:334 length:210 start_codon:yes stop_codon:yes gene_type:complete